MTHAIDIIDGSGLITPKEEQYNICCLFHSKSYTYYVRMYVARWSASVLKVGIPSGIWEFKRKLAYSVTVIISSFKKFYD